MPRSNSALRTLRALGSLVLGSAVAIGGLVLPASTAHADSTVVARRDVDGDKRKDTVSVEKIDGTLIVTVRTARGRSDDFYLSAASFGRWHGAAAIDKRRGAELVLLVNGGAHTLQYKVLTWRKGQLRAVKSPSRNGWLVDSAYAYSVGWKRYVRDGRAYVRETALYRDNGSTWKGTKKTWVARGHRWKRVSNRSVTVRGDRKADKYAGWHVKGLKRGLG